MLMFAAWVFFVPAMADTPLTQARLTKRASANGLFLVISSPSKGITYATGKGGKRLWTIKSCFREFFVSNDGLHFVGAYGGANLLPENYSDSLILASVWQAGIFQFNITASQVIPDRSILVRTNSHYLWGDVIGIDAENHLVINRVDGEKLIFDLTDGTQLDSQKWSMPANEHKLK